MLVPALLAVAAARDASAAFPFPGPFPAPFAFALAFALKALKDVLLPCWLSVSVDPMDVHSSECGGDPAGCGGAGMAA